jgi:opacity protein-like surface antigen
MTPSLYRRLFIAAIVGASALSTHARAQTPARFGLEAGATEPVSTYGSDKNVGYHIGILVDVRLPPTPFGFRVDGTFHEMKYSGNSTKAQIFMTTANGLLKVPTGTPLAPYLIGGVGLYNNSRRTLLFNTRSSTDVGVNLGGGVRFELRDVTTFVEARYHSVTGDAHVRIVPITVGVLF